MNKFKEWLIIKGYTKKSIETIIQATGYFLVWGDSENITDIAAVTHNDIIAYIQYYNLKGTGKKTIAHYILHLKKYFDWLMTEGEVSDNPCSNIKIKGIKRKVLHEILSVEELEKLYNDYATEITLQKTERMKCLPPMTLHTLARKRNKIILGLIVYQGLRTRRNYKAANH